MELLLRILSALSDSIVELSVVLFGTLSTFISNQIIKFFREKRKEHLAEKKKKEMDIINQVTDKVALEVDSLHSDLPYEEQRAIAIEKARVILERKDVDISEEELSAEIEDGFSKLPSYTVEDEITDECEVLEEGCEEEAIEEVKPLKTPLKRSTRRIHNSRNYVIQSEDTEENLIIFYTKKGSK